jgi:hypothetical protein
MERRIKTFCSVQTYDDVLIRESARERERAFWYGKYPKVGIHIHSNPISRETWSHRSGAGSARLHFDGCLENEWKIRHHRPVQSSETLTLSPDERNFKCLVIRCEIILKRLSMEVFFKKIICPDPAQISEDLIQELWTFRPGEGIPLPLYISSFLWPPSCMLFIYLIFEIVELGL